MGPLSDKSCSEAQELLDLQIIDKNKQLDLLRFRVQKVSFILNNRFFPSFFSFT